ncbi:hypothetical protein DB346_17955 [Verrucomicrobia bacterium LW23]|nr:hypothetical protein DB346_17955 [Verrucomicrobia bacterium LW23]
MLMLLATASPARAELGSKVDYSLPELVSESTGIVLCVAEVDGRKEPRLRVLETWKNSASPGAPLFASGFVEEPHVMWLAKRSNRAPKEGQRYVVYCFTTGQRYFVVPENFDKTYTCLHPHYGRLSLWPNQYRNKVRSLAIGPMPVASYGVRTLTLYAAGALAGAAAPVLLLLAALRFGWLKGWVDAWPATRAAERSRSGIVLPR